MVIVLFCVFGIMPDSSGILKKTTLQVDESQYWMMRTEIGNQEKKKACHGEFHEVPDLAWFEDANPTR